MKPEFEKEYYLNQIKLMEERYSKIFSKWGISWNKFYSYITESMQNNYYWIWSFLNGTEKTIKECQELKGKERRLYLYEETKIRVSNFKKKIIYKENNLINYLNNL